jgi:uncharacterized surface protein with fasciclin (FAS1) repeats
MATVLQLAVATPELSTLVELLKVAELTGALNGQGNFTVFAPTNAAFSKLDSKMVASLLLPEHRDKLRSILLYHVLGMRVHSQSIGVDVLTPHTLQGKNLCIYRDRFDVVHVNDTHVIKADIQASNGVIHLIDGVLTPSHSCHIHH